MLNPERQKFYSLARVGLPSGGFTLILAQAIAQWFQRKLTIRSKKRLGVIHAWYGTCEFGDPPGILVDRKNWTSKKFTVTIPKDWAQTVGLQGIATFSSVFVLSAKKHSQTNGQTHFKVIVARKATGAKFDIQEAHLIRTNHFLAFGWTYAVAQEMARRYSTQLAESRLNGVEPASEYGDLFSNS